MKTKNIFLSVIIAAFLSSSIPYGSHSLEIGSEAPSLVLSSKSSADLAPLKGNKVLLNFWSASDAGSRMANRFISDAAESGKYPDTRFVSVCIDSDSALAAQIRKADRISGKVISLNSDEISNDVMEDFQTSKGCRSFLIDSFGNLEAIAPSAAVSSMI